LRKKVVSGTMLALFLAGILIVGSRVASAVEESSSSAGHDVAVVNVVPSKTVVAQGYYLPTNVTVENKGDFAETFNVTAYYSNGTLTPEQWETFWSRGDVNRDGYIDDIDFGLFWDAYDSKPGDWNWNPDADFDKDGDVDSWDSYIVSGGYGLDIWTYFHILGGRIGNSTVNDLLPTNSITFVFLWNTTDVPQCNYTISAKATRVPGETNTTDNTFIDGKVQVKITGYIVGDLDGDGDVDSTDFYLFSGKYGSEEGDEIYDAKCDFDCDGDVDSFDFYLFSGKYGQSIYD
jgi:hypothetical protein